MRKKQAKTVIIATLLLISSLSYAELSAKPNTKASKVKTVTTNFNKNLSSADTDVQKALDTIDDMSTMAYPSAGIAVSTGSAWGTSLTDNHSNWDTAYGWGNHSGLYLPIGGGTLTGDLSLGSHNLTATGYITGKKLSTADNDGRSLTIAELNQTWVCTSADPQTFPLPSVDATNQGCWVTIIKAGAGRVTIDAADSDTIADSGAGDTIYDAQTNETYATITLQLASETKWVIIGASGTWTTTD